ncbi:MAG: DUF2975 domain-containing protein [Asticcacaulis sp.]
MNVSPITDEKVPSRLQAECRRLGLLILIATPLLLVLIVLDRTGVLMASGLTGRGAGWRDWARAIVALVPALIYLFCLWRTGAALRDIGREGRFVAAIAETLRRVGVALSLGALFQIAIAPTLAKAFGQGPGYWIGLDSAALTLGVLGLVLMIFARLFRRAARMESELDEII